MPPRQRRRLDADRDGVLDLLHLGSVSVQGLADLMSRIARSNVQEASRRNLMELNHETFAKHKHVETMPLKDGTTFDWEYISPDLWLHSLLCKSSKLQDIWQEALRRHPVSADRPWRLVIGYDEFSPGNKLQVDNRLSR